MLGGRALKAVVAAGASAAFAGAPASGASEPPTRTSAAAAPHLVAPSGAWCWFADPRAVVHRGAHHRTYVSWVDRNGTVAVSSFDHDTRRVAVGALVTGFQVDDHDNPALHVRGDGRIVAFWSAHSGPSLFYRVTRNPEDVTRWGPLRHMTSNSAGPRGYTYPNPVALPAERRLWLFWRGADRQPTFATSPDEGWTWTRARTLIDAAGPGRTPQRPYVKYARSGDDTIHLAFTRAHPGERATGIHYVRYRRGGFERASGRRVATLADLPLGLGDVDTVYDVARHGARAWIHDVAADAAGRPVIVYATFPARGDHRYRYARWTGTAWLDRELVRAGPSFVERRRQAQYSGGIVLDPTNPSVVYLSRSVSGVHELERWTTPDGGVTWNATPLTRGSTSPNVRPFVPRGEPRGDLGLLWMRGAYPDFTRFATRLLALGGTPWPATPRVPARRVRRATRPALAATVARARHGLLRTRVRCPRAAVGGCYGTLTLRAGGRAIARGPYRLLAGSGARPALRPTPTGRRVLARGRTITARLRAHGTDGADRPSNAERGVRVAARAR